MDIINGFVDNWNTTRYCKEGMEPDFAIIVFRADVRDGRDGLLKPTEEEHKAAREALLAQGWVNVRFGQDPFSNSPWAMAWVGEKQYIHYLEPSRRFAPWLQAEVDAGRTLTLRDSMADTSLYDSFYPPQERDGSDDDV